jgi:SDR family mycofactocin-dependent oxidoreductase
MGRVNGKVAFITGAARGQGRAHAVRLAEEGADIIAVDICEPVSTVEYQAASPEDLAQTQRLVEAKGRNIVTSVVDTRDFGAVHRAVTEGVERLGRLDIVIANAGIMGRPAKIWEFTTEEWTTTIDTNLNGVWHTIKATAPVLIEQGTGGSMILTASTAGAKGAPNFSNYVAAKHGVIGMMKSAALELGEYAIRVNAILPTSVDTHLIQYQSLYNLFRPDLESPTREDTMPSFRSMHVLPLDWLDPSDIADAGLWLASDEAKYVTGLEVRIDAGFAIK